MDIKVAIRAPSGMKSVGWVDNVIDWREARYIAKDLGPPGTVVLALVPKLRPEPELARA